MRQRIQAIIEKFRACKPLLHARYFLWFCLLLLLRPALAQDTHRSDDTKVLFLLLCDGMTWDDIASGQYPHLREFAERGSIALMNCTVTGKRDNVSALLTLATGQRLPAEPADAFAANHNEHILTERGDALTLFARRTGSHTFNGRRVLVDNQAIVHLNIASLKRRGIVEQSLGHLLYYGRAGGGMLLGNIDTDIPQRTAALLMMNTYGETVGRFDIFRPDPTALSGKRDDPLRLAQFAYENFASFTVIMLREPATLDLFLYLLQENLKHIESVHPNILIVSPRPPETQNRLTPVLAAGPDFPPGLFTSATTRTPGLIANTDIAPTILDVFNLAAPPVMIGKPATVLKSTHTAERLAALSRLDYIAQLNDQVLHRVMPIFAIVFALYFLLLFLRSQSPRWLVLGLVPILFLPAALLLAPLLVPPTFWEYALRIVAWQFALTVLALILARLTHRKLPVLIAAINIILILGDILSGQTLLKDSLLSGYALSGIRYYGIGNEYLGVLLAFVLTGTFLALDNRETLTQRTRLLIIFSWVGTLFVLGWVGLGANAGSLVAGVTGFGVGTAILYERRPTWKLALVCIIFGLLLAFAFGSLEAFLLPTQKNGGGSHFGTALRTAANQNNAGYLLEIATRKAAMNLRLFLMPAFLAILAALSLAGFLGYCRFRSVLTVASPPASWIRRALPAFLATAVSALIFKDSGVITVAFFLALSAFLLLLSALSPPKQNTP